MWKTKINNNVTLDWISTAAPQTDRFIAYAIPDSCKCFKPNLPCPSWRATKLSLESPHRCPVASSFGSSLYCCFSISDNEFTVQLLYSSALSAVFVYVTQTLAPQDTCSLHRCMYIADWYLGNCDYRTHLTIIRYLTDTPPDDPQEILLL